jgi:hypothetical protein
MRGFQRPAVRPTPTEAQVAFQGLSRHRRTKLARAALTTLVRADRWSRGGLTPAEVATSLETALRSLQAQHAAKK